MIRYPGKRQAILRDIQWMADANLNTVDPKAYDFNLTMSLFFDDSRLDVPEQQMGFILRNTDEVESIKYLVDLMDRVYRHVGSHAPDIEYLEDEAWPQVAEAARAALQVLNRNA